AVEIGDFDGDGLGDAARVVTWQDWTLIDVFHNTGDGFESAYTQTIGGYYDRAASGDLDGDGRDDLVLGGASGSVVVVTGTPWGSAQPLGCASYEATGLVDHVTQLDLGDYDGDGRLDIAAADGNAVVVLVGAP
ncbi:MAG: VCBS repeat-containing protein, partial [Deltaproteobacteria bacterium]|nr:VCBS repeat-containing protein [Nannocystaceae bacterium]